MRDRSPRVEKSTPTGILGPSFTRNSEDRDFMALISLQNTTLRFGGPAVLQDVNLQLEAGERVCVVGRNGEGKSTLLRVLAGAQEPDAGQVIRSKGLIAA